MGRGGEEAGREGGTSVRVRTGRGSEMRRLSKDEEDGWTT